MTPLSEQLSPNATLRQLLSYPLIKDQIPKPKRAQLLALEDDIQEVGNLYCFDNNHNFTTTDSSNLVIGNYYYYFMLEEKDRKSSELNLNWLVLIFIMNKLY